MPFAHGPVLCYVGAGQYKTVGTTEYVGSDERITVPDGFPTDLASVPRLFWSLLPPSGAYERAAVLHDYLCVELADIHRKGDSWRQWRGWPETIARDTDGLFRRVMREAGVGFCTRWIMWTGVRLGALANPARRSGWLRDAPLVITLCIVVGTVACGVFVGIAALVAWVLGWI